MMSVGSSRFTRLVLSTGAAMTLTMELAKAKIEKNAVRILVSLAKEERKEVVDGLGECSEVLKTLV